MLSGADRAAWERQLMAEIAVEFPDWDVEHVPGIGFEAFPKGTVILRTITLDRMKGKLAKHAGQKAGEP
jgi:hypothetical protein